MATFYPVIITTAIFIALILDDILKETPENVPVNTLQGLISIGLMLILSFKDMEFISWGLLILIFIIILISYHFGILTNKTVSGSGAPVLPPVMSCSTTATGSPSTISIPSSPALSGNVAGSSYTFTPITSCSK